MRGFVLPHINEVLATITNITTLPLFRHMTTPSGFTMSVALTNCGQLGWTSNQLKGKTGYCQVNLKYAISRVHSGYRIGLELLFHNQA